MTLTEFSFNIAVTATFSEPSCVSFVATWPFSYWPLLLLVVKDFVVFEQAVFESAEALEVCSCFLKIKVKKINAAQVLPCSCFT